MGYHRTARRSTSALIAMMLLIFLHLAFTGCSEDVDQLIEKLKDEDDAEG